jgi:hypothetical protein
MMGGPREVSMARSVCWLLVVPMLVAVGCGSSVETVGQVRDRHRPAMNKLRAQLKDVYARIPAIAQAQRSQLVPAPIFAEDGSGNTEFMAFEHLLDTEAPTPLDLSLPQDLKTCLSWTGPAGADDPSTRREATPDVEARFQKAQKTRYLVVLRGRKAPVTGSGTTFSGGDAEVEAFVVDLQASAVVASVSARGGADAPIQVVAASGRQRQERAQTMLSATAVAEVRADLATKLAAATGGSFQFPRQRSVLSATAP